LSLWFAREYSNRLPSEGIDCACQVDALEGAGGSLPMLAIVFSSVVAECTTI
jgi:hypothetical protein